MKKLSIFLLLALILSFTFISCTGDKAEDELTQEQIDQIITDTISANNEADKYKFDMDMSMTMKASGGASPGTLNMEMDSTGVIDVENKAQQMFMTMARHMLGIGEELELEAYIIDEWMYIKISGEEWTKTKVTTEIWETQDRIEQQIELLSSGEVGSIRSEVLDGIDCYKLEITPTNMGLLAQMVFEQQGTEGLQNMEEVLSSSSINYTLWVAKDSSLLMKTFGDLSMELSPENILGATHDDFEKMDMDMVVEILFYDYNQPVIIELPSEATEATPEVPDDWYDALIYLREETPEDAIIMTWWDYGYWIRDIAERTPVVDKDYRPEDILRDIAQVYCTDQDSDAIEVMRKYGASYLVISMYEADILGTIASYGPDYPYSIEQLMEESLFARFLGEDILGTNRFGKVVVISLTQ